MPLRLLLSAAVIWIPATLVAVVTLLPLCYLLVRSLAAGGELWDHLWRARTAWTIARTGVLVLTVTGASVLVALPLAWLTVRTDLPGRRFWSVASALPLAIPSYVGALAVVAALGPRGLLQQLLEVWWGIERLPEIYGLPGAVLTLTLLSYPYVLLSARAALLGLDPSFEEASRSLGASSWRTFFRVVLPQLAPATAAGALLVALYTLSDFGAVSLLRFESFTHVIYLQYQSTFDRTLAASFAVLLSLLALLVLWLEARMRSRARFYRSGAGAVRPFAVTALGWWRWPALAYCAGVVSLALVLPLAVLSWWLVRGLLAGQSLQVLWEPALNSLAVAALAAVLCLGAAFPVAVLSVRFPGWFASLVERAAYLSFALPGLVVALALVFFTARYLPALYQTLALLLLAYTVLFLAQTVGATRAALLQVKPSYEEAGRSLGRSFAAVLWTITLPLVRPGLLSGAALTFLAVMKELPATLLLSPTGFRTLATTTWSAADDGFFTRAAAPALCLVVLTALPMAFLLGNARNVSR